MRQVLLTGATGFIGRRLLEYNKNKDIHIHRALRKSDGQSGVVVGEIGPKTDWSKAIDNIDCVIHLAARVHVMNDDAIDPLSEFRYVNVEGTLNLARQATKAGVKRFIYISSIKVNGEKTQLGSPFSADSHPTPIDPYGISKYEAEQGLLKIANETNMEVVIIRPPLVYGPGVKANFLSMMRWLNKGVPLPFGAVSNARSLVALDNLVDLIITCIDHPKAVNEVFLVSDGQDLSTTELLKMMASALNKPVRLIPVPTMLLSYFFKLIGKRTIAMRLFGSLQVDIRKTRTVLGWEPPLSVEKALKLTADDYLRSAN